MKWNWDSRLWKRSTKLLLGFATAWPYVYLLLFFGGVLAITLFLSPNQRPGYCGDTGVVQLEQKIRNGELKELVVRPTEILARNRRGTCEYRVVVRDEFERKEILRKARELDARGEPLVPQNQPRGRAACLASCRGRLCRGFCGTYADDSSAVGANYNLYCPGD